MRWGQSLEMNQHGHCAVPAATGFYKDLELTESRFGDPAMPRFFKRQTMPAFGIAAGDFDHGWMFLVCTSTPAKGIAVMIENLFFCKTASRRNFHESLCSLFSFAFSFFSAAHAQDSKTSPMRSDRQLRTLDIYASFPMPKSSRRFLDSCRCWQAAKGRRETPSRSIYGQGIRPSFNDTAGAERGDGVLIRDVAQSFKWVHDPICRVRLRSQARAGRGHSAGAQLAAITARRKIAEGTGSGFDVLIGAIP